MATLSKAEILKSVLYSEPMDVPEWGGTVFVSEMTGTELGQWQKIARDPEREDIDSVIALAIFTISDEDGNRLFDMNNMEDLKRKGIQVFLRLQNVALRINKLTDSDMDELKGN